MDQVRTVLQCGVVRCQGREDVGQEVAQAVWGVRKERKLLPPGGRAFVPWLARAVEIQPLGCCYFFCPEFERNFLAMARLDQQTYILHSHSRFHRLFDAWLDALFGAYNHMNWTASCIGRTQDGRHRTLVYELQWGPLAF